MSSAIEGNVPDWFASRQIKREAQSVDLAVRKVDKNTTESKSAWFHRFLRIVATGYCVSALLHVAVLIIFSLVIYHATDGGHVLSTQVGIAESEDEEILDPRSFEISAGSEGVEEVQPDIVETVPIPLPEPTEPIADSKPVELKGKEDGTGKDDKQQEGSGNDQRFAMAHGGAIVRKGSFAGWTIPADPRPGQSYAIIVEITLPEGTTQFNRTDLSGYLLGTDGYRIMIPDGREFNGVGWERPLRMPQFHRDGDVARIVFFVRGSSQPLVRDTIKIHSNLLDETQELEIVF